MSMRDNDEVVERVSAPTTLQQGSLVSEVRPAGLESSVRRGDQGDRTRWGPIWAGTAVAVAVYLLLELLLLAFDALDVDVAGSTDLPDGWFWTVVAAAVAFLIGGVVAGASMRSRRTDDGVLHGIVVWALGTIVLVVLAALGARLALGMLGTLFGRLDADPAAAGAGDNLQDAAGAAALALGASLVAGAVGGLIGSKLWPRHDDNALRLRPGTASNVSVRS